MKKLTKENIQFIDTYLKNFDVIFFDIRIEMTDHVASEIEAKMSRGDARDFYDIFKSYMVEHKKGLLKNLNKFKWQATKKAFKQIFINSYHPKTLFFTVVSMLCLFWGWNFLEFSVGYSVNFSVSLLMLTLFMILMTVLKKKVKFSVLHELISITLILNYSLFHYLLDSSFMQTWSLVCVTLVVWFNVSCIKSILDLKLHYKKQLLI